MSWTIRHGTLQPLVLAIAFVLITTSCSPRSASRKAWIAWASLTAGYPYFASIIADGNGRSWVYFFTLDGRWEKTLKLQDVSFNGVTLSENNPLEALITGHSDGKHNLYKYDIEQEIIETIMSSYQPILSPFYLDGTPCALMPNIITQKGAYEFDILCKGIRKTTKERIKSGGYNISADGRAIFTEGFDEANQIEIQNKEVKITPVDLPKHRGNTPELFSFAGRFYATNRSRSQMWQLDSGAPTPLSRDKFPPIPELPKSGNIRIVFVDNEKAVVAAFNEKIPSIEITQTDKSTKKTSAILFDADAARFGRHSIEAE